MVKRNISDKLKNALNNLHHASHIFCSPRSQTFSILGLANQEIWNEWKLGNSYSFARIL